MRLIPTLPAFRPLRWAMWLCLCLTIAPVAAYDWTPRAETARFQRVTTEQGLSQSSVMAIAQDRRGRIWLGTQSGLNRFDGHDVTVFRPGPGPIATLSDNYVTALAIDDDGQLWVGTLDGLNRLDPDSGMLTVFRNRADDPASLSASRMQALHVDAHGTLWVGTERGLSRWRPQQQAFDSWSSALGNADGLPDDRIVTIASDAEGRLLVGSVLGLARFDPATGQFEPISPPELAGVEVNAVMVDDRQRVWVGTDGDGVLRGSADLSQWRRLGDDGAEQGKSGSRSVRSLLQDRSGRVWIGTDLGLDMIDERRSATARERFRHYRHNADGLGGGRVAALFEDRSGSIWAGTWNGGASWLSRSRNRFESFTPDQPVTAALRNPASITLAARDRALWIGSGEGLYRFDADRYRLTPVDRQRDATTFFASADVDQQLWFGNADGLLRVDPGTGIGQPQTLPPVVSNLRVRRLWVDPERVWIAVDPLGLGVLDRSLQRMQQLHRIERSVTFIEPLGDRFRLVGAYDGLYWLDAGTGELLHVHRISNGADPASGLRSAPMDFAPGPDGRLWLATNGGGLLEILLERSSDPTTARFVAHEGGRRLADPALKALLVDPAGTLWLSTASGISAYDPVRGNFSNFGHGDGALGNDYINGSATPLPDGRLAFGAMDGFTLFDPAGIDLQAPPAPPAPLITGLELDGRRAPVTADGPVSAHVGNGQVLQIEAGRAASVALSFASPDFVDADALRYGYRLEGVNADWVEVDASRRVASFTNLKPGDYMFRVRAAHGQSGWSEPTRVDLVVQPFWWQTWWATGAAILLGIGLLAFVYHLRVRHSAQLRDMLTRQVAERTAALEEAKTHAEDALSRLESTQQELVRAEKLAALGQLVGGVAHEVNTPLGVALTASSYVTDATGAIEKAVADGSLKRSDLTAFLSRVNDAHLMIQRNLDRAGQLITNFKQVSVDRSSDGRREFELCGYLNELLQSLQLMWKHQSIETRIECHGPVVLDSFPGALGQIITNLMQNSVRHGMSGEHGGLMTLSARQLDPERVEIRHVDNGIGIPPEHLGRIFDPFFTTQRNQGGTGLGLHIVFNLVTQKLGGTITVDSRPGQGATFVITLPVRAPS